MSDICMTVVDQTKLEALHRGLSKCPGTINAALGQSSISESGDIVTTQSLRVEHDGVEIDLMLTHTNVASCQIRNGKLPLQVCLPDGSTVCMTLDVKEANGHIGGWVRTTSANIAALKSALVTA